MPGHALPMASAKRPAAERAVAVAAFTPGHALPLVLDTIRGARSSIFVAAYAFTSRPVAVALRDAARAGVKVVVIVDAGEATKDYSAARFLANERVPVRFSIPAARRHSTSAKAWSHNWPALESCVPPVILIYRPIPGQKESLNEP